MYLLELRLKLCGRAKCFPGQETTPRGIERLEHQIIKYFHMAGISKGKPEKESRKRKAFACSLLVVYGTRDPDESNNR